MPGIFHQPISRKQFLGTSIAAMGTWASEGVAWASEPAEDICQIALLSDTHVPADKTEACRGFRPYDNLAKAVAQVAAASPQGVLINGDAARLTGQVADYQALRELLKPLSQQTPIYIGLGNHDNRKNFFDVFGKSTGVEQTIAGKHTLVVETPPVRILILDSLLYVNKVAGLLGKAQRTWLANYLGHADPRPTVLAFHHTLGDGDGDLLDIDRLYQIVEPHQHVKAIFYGHSHHYGVSRRGNLHLINLPAVGYNFNDQEPVGWVAANFTKDGVSLTLHAIGGNQADHGKTRTISWS